MMRFKMRTLLLTVAIAGLGIWILVNTHRIVRERHRIDARLASESAHLKSLNSRISTYEAVLNTLLQGMEGIKWNENHGELAKNPRDPSGLAEKLKLLVQQNKFFVSVHGASLP